MTVLGCIIISIVAITGACFAHGRVETKMRRAKFVFCALSTAGTALLGYVLIWAWSGQHPPYSLKLPLLLGVVLWASALAYSAVFLLCQRDIAPSK